MKRNFGFAVLIAMSLMACDKNENPSFTKAKIEGLSQKGPFVNGSSLTLFELDDSYAQTGKSFNTQIVDNLGSFELSNIGIQTSFAKLKADGYYFNEIKNTNSASSIALYAFSDLTDKSTVNVNLLSTLEVSRIEYLLAQGIGFDAAKQQAQHEVAAIFSIYETGIPDSELLDISKAGDDNAVLLAISLILQGYRTEAELTQLLGDIATDIRTDGVLSSPIIGTSLINDAKLLSLPTIRNNIDNKYLSLGETVSIPDFEKYVTQFIDSTNYVFEKFIEYPFIVNTKMNLLKDSVFEVLSGTDYSVGVLLPIGTSIKVVVKSTPGFDAVQYGWLIMENDGWGFNNHYPDSAVLTAVGDNKIVNIPFRFGPPSSLDFIIYENNSPTPTRTKTIQY
ncbi:MAG: hypothetical protein Q8T08_14400 [Ignavibacteria bacterium]|nr:hypothetical protein [Ignavibacteria bacterium]